MKYKAKPIRKAEIREHVENKMRARGAVFFLGLLFAGATGLFMLAFADLWPARFDYAGLDRLFIAAVPYTILGMIFVIRFLRYTFDYGARYEKHLDETEALINRQRQHSRADEWEDQEELIRIRQADKLKHRRLLLQHIALFLALMGPLALLRWAESNVNGWDLAESMTTTFYLVGVWGIGLVAHILRQVFGDGALAARRQAWIDAEVARELAALERENRPVTDRQAQPAPGMGSSHERLSIDALVAEELEHPKREMRT